MSSREYPPLGRALAISLSLLLLLQSLTTISTAVVPESGLVASATGQPTVDANHVEASEAFDHDAADDEVTFYDTEDSFEDASEAIILDGATDKSLVVAEGQSGPPQPGVLARLSGATKAALAPIKGYYELMGRYHNWRVEYNKLQVEFGMKPNGEPKIRDWNDIMRLEYANVDKMLAEERCTSQGSEEPQNMDFIWKVLKLLIDRLETELEELKRKGQEGAEESQKYALETYERLEKIESSAKEATDRAKGIITRAAAGVAKRELAFILELLVSNKLATYVAHASHIGLDGQTTLMGRIEPFVLLLGYVDTPLIVSYLRNIRFRAVLNLTHYYMSALTCSRKPKAITYTPEGPREVLAIKAADDSD